MLKKLISIAGFGFSGYMIFSMFQNNTGISTADGQGGYLETGAGDLIGGFMSVSGFNLNMNISLNGLAYIKGWEKLRLNRYLDEGGKPTIGYGHLIKTFESYDTITEAEANTILLKDLETAISAVNKGVKVKITQGNFDALVSFAFNVGAGGFLSSTLLKLLNKGDISGAKAQFGRWIYIGSKQSAGLINRRAGDAQLFIG